MFISNIKKKDLPQIFLRIGLATIFTYAAVSSFVNPQDWVGYLPGFATDIITDTTLLTVFSVYELFLALWLLSGKYIKYVGALCAMTLAGIILFNFNLFIITFRDIALIFACLALISTDL